MCVYIYTFSNPISFFTNIRIINGSWIDKLWSIVEYVVYIPWLQEMVNQEN